MENLTRRILLWSLFLTVALGLAFLLICTLDPGPAEQVYQLRLQLQEAARQLGHDSPPPLHEFGRANLPPYLGRGRRELVFWFALLAGLGTLASWRIARPIDRALGQLAEDCQRLERGEPADAGSRGGALAGIAEDFARMLSILEQRQQELNQTTEAAEQALELREKLLDHSHAEFRQPLIRMSASLEGLPEHPYLVTIRRNLASLLQLVDDLAAPGPRLRLETVELEDFLRQTLEAFPQRLRLQSGPSVRLELDRLRTGQALLNLVSNALKYSHQEVEVSWGEDWIEVRDQGQGMEPAEIPQLLREFRQLQPGRHDGVGLGLATVERCMQLQGGQLKISSRPGQGTLARLQFTSDRRR